MMHSLLWCRTTGVGTLTTISSFGKVPMSRGDVIEVDWPFTDMTGTKPRPAVVVQADFLNGLIDDTVYVKIQSMAYQPVEKGDCPSKGLRVS
jgi:hypothetical protein